MALNTISQRIALEGAEDVLKQLADLGTAGERAFAQLQQAGEGMSPTLSGLSGIIGSVKDAFGQIGSVLGPVKDRFGEFAEALKGVFENVTKVAEVFGVGLVAGVAGGVAGLFELIQSSAEAGHQLEIQSGVLGLTVEQLQVYRKAAADAGVDADKLFTSLARLAQNVGKEQEKLVDDAAKGLLTLPLAAQQVGTSVVDGVQPAGNAIKSHIISNIQEANTAATALAPVLLKAFPDLSKNNIGVAQLIPQLQQAGTEAGKAGEAFRLAFAPVLGSAAFPALTIGEQLKTQTELAKDPLAKLGISLKDLQDNSTNLDPIIRRVLDGIAGIQNPSERATVGLATLGRGWREIIGAFKDGTIGLDAVRAALEESGLLLDEFGAKKLSDAEKAFVTLGAAGTALRNQLAVIFAPGLTQIATAFTDVIKTNADTLKAWAQSIANGVLPAISNLIKQFLGVKDAAKGVPATPPVPPLPDVVTGKTGVGVVQVPPPATVNQAPLDNAKPAVGATEPPPGSIDTASLDTAQAKLEKFRAAVVSIAGVISEAFTIARVVLTSVAEGLNSLFGTNFTAGGVAAVVILGTLSGAFSLLLPLILLAGALIGALATPIGATAVLLGVLAANIVHFWPQISEGASAATSAIGAAAEAIAGFFISIPTRVAAGFFSALGAVTGFFSALGGAVTGFFSALGGAVTGFFSALGGAVTGFFSAISSGIQSLVEVVVPRIAPIFSSIASVIQSIAQPIGAAFGPVLGAAIAGSEELLNGLVDWARGTVTGIVGAFSNVGSAIKNAFQGALSFVEDLFDGFINGIQFIAQKIIAVLQPVVSFIQSIGNALASALGGAGGAAAAASSGGPSAGLGLDSVAEGMFASGGHVGGPSGTDRVPAWLTAGEYVVRAEAVDHYGTQLFAAFNTMRVPLSDIGERFSLGGLVGAIAMRPPSPALRLADGGIVAGPRSVGTVNLSLEGKSFPLSVQPGEVFDKLARHARSSAIRSAGRKPSWYES